MSEWGRMQDVIHDELDRQGITERVDVNALIECIANVADFFPGLLGTLDAATPRPGLVEAAQALVDEWDAAMAGDMPLNGHYQKQALDRLRAALASGTGEPGLDVELLSRALRAATLGTRVHVSVDEARTIARRQAHEYAVRLANDKGADPTPEPK